MNLNEIEMTLKFGINKMMKKRFFVSCLAVVLGVTVMMADRPTDFINKYELFVNEVAELDCKTAAPETMDSLKLVYKELTKEYKGVKKIMTQIQLEKYYNLKAKYQKTVTLWKTKRGARAVGGWVKGTFGKKKE